MRLEVIQQIRQIPQQAWNALEGASHPFLSYEFLSALEDHHCVQRSRGWQPWHLLLYQGNRLVAAAPAYLKGHSWGEFVFDWSWAEAHERRGLDYYPKLVSAIPFSPVTGPRVLVAEGTSVQTAVAALGAGAQQQARSNGLSSMHWLFPEPDQARLLAAAGYQLRYGCQFHWHNRGYDRFEDFLGELTSKKRKNIRHERAAVTAQGIEFKWLHGSEIDASTWAYFIDAYSDTFERHSNLPPLNLEFFMQISRTMGERVVLLLALRGAAPVAAALCLRGPDALYGRYWGATEEIGGLHFETCYYQGIEYCIRHRLNRFEPGAQGEHKLARGFLPTMTYSAHWVRDLELRSAIAGFLRREQPHIEAYASELAAHSPYRQPPG